MSDKRKAELQRKLAMGTPPRPPAGLADRIKADIPQSVLPVQPAEPERIPDRSIWHSAAAMRIAASILLLITTGLITWRVVQPPAPREVSSRAQGRLVPAITRTRTQSKEERAVAAPAPPVAATASKAIEEPVDLTSIAPEESVAAVSAPRREMQHPEVAQANDAIFESITEVTTITASAPAAVASSQAAAFEAIPPAAPAPPPPPPSAARSAGVGATASLQVAREASEKAATEETLTFYGVSIDPRGFERVRAAIARGEVASTSVDVEAIVNHFAFETASSRRTYVQSAELSSAPLDRNRAVLRISIDASPGAPALRNTSLSVAFDRDSVLDVRRVGQSEPFEMLRTPPAVSSMTVLYELTLRPSLDPAAVIARVAIEGDSDGSVATVAASQLRPWAEASTRHRRATLAGAWAESLTRSPEDLSRVVGLAQALTKEVPSDDRARDLARAAEASAALPR